MHMVRRTRACWSMPADRVPQASDAQEKQETAMIPRTSIPIHPARPDIEGLLVEDEAKGDYRLHRSAFTDPQLFELEMQHIFEGNWIYLAHESQVLHNNDYYTTHM